MASLSVQTLQTERRISSISLMKPPASAPPGTRAFNESDLNADTCCLGANFIVLSMTSRIADVYAYDKNYAPSTNVPIVTGATAWDDIKTGTTYILIFNESLFYGPKLDHTLINPNQLRSYGIDWDNPYEKYHQLGIELEGSLRIPMMFSGTKLRFESRVPTRLELETCEHIELTSRAAWNPDVVKLGEVKVTDPILDSKEMSIVISSTIVSFTPACSYTDDVHAYKNNFCGDNILHSVNPVLVSIKELIISQDNTGGRDTEDDIPVRRTFVSYSRHNKISAESIAELWCIGIKRAKDTMNTTTQRGTRSAILPISRRYRADRRFTMKRLNGKFSSDTLYMRKSSH